MININLLSPELKIRKIAVKRNAQLISICIVITFIILVLAIISKSLETTIKDNLNLAKQNIDDRSNQLDSSSELQDLAYLINDRAASTDSINQTRAIWSQIMQELSNCAPSDIQFDNLTCTSAKIPNFNLQGNTVNDREIIKFQEKLENSPLFKNVKFKNSSTSGGKLNFNLEFDLEQLSLSANVSGASSSIGGEKSIK